MVKVVYNEFVRACAKGENIKVIEMLNNGEDPNQIDDSIVEEATIQEQVRIIQPDPYWSRGYRGLHAAMKLKKAKTASILLEHGADPLLTSSKDEFDPYGTPPIVTAIYSGFFEGIRLLHEDWGVGLPEDDNPEYKNPNNILFHSIPSNCGMIGAEEVEKQLKLAEPFIKVFEYLVNKFKLSPNNANTYGNNFLFNCCSYAVPLPFLENLLKNHSPDLYAENILEKLDDDKKDMAQKAGEAMYEFGMDIFGEEYRKFSKKSQEFRTNPYIDLAYDADLPRIKLLTKYGADPEYKDSKGNNALTAAWTGHSFATEESKAKYAKTIEFLQEASNSRGKVLKFSSR